MALFKRKSKTNAKNQAHTASTGLAKKKGFKFKWWMAVILIVIVGGVGLLVLRFSRADTPPSEDEVYRTMSEYGYQYYGVTFSSIDGRDGKKASVALLPTKPGDFKPGASNWPVIQKDSSN